MELAGILNLPGQKGERKRDKKHRDISGHDT